MITLRDYVENWNGCFIAGKLVDKGFRLLKIIKLEQPLVPPWFELVKEPDDLGTMARDHFERAIKPTLRKSSWRENLDPVTPIAPVPRGAGRSRRSGGHHDVPSLWPFQSLEWAVRGDFMMTSTDPNPPALKPETLQEK